MKKFFLAILFFTIGILTAQTKYMIYLKDKGIDPQIRLNKSSSLFYSAEKELTQRSIERRKKVMGEDYITYEDIPVNENYIKEIEGYGIKIINRLKWFNAVSCYLTIEEINKIKYLPFVKEIKPVGKFISRNPNQLNDNNVIDESQRLNKTNYTLNYGPSLTQNELSDIPVVHDLGINGNGVLVGLLDTGFRWQSTASLENKNVIAERDFIQSDNVTANQSGDDSGQDSHGTNVFSIISGYAPGWLIGPAYGASFLLAKTEYVPSETHVEEDNYAAALEWMDAQGVDITSSSLGYSIFDNTTYSYTYEDMNGNTTIVAQAANLAFDRGIITLTAAGNEGSFWGVGNGGISSPGDAFNIITVGGVNSSNQVVSFSSRGPTSDGRIKPDLVAQGLSVYHSNVGSSTYSFGNGTSYATPITAGIAALLKSAFPHLTNRQVRQIMLESGDNVASPNNDRGYGLISARKAVEFPNLSYLNNKYFINKIFTDKSVQPLSVLINYKIDNGNYQSALMSYDGNLYYSFEIPQLSDGSVVNFYITYQNATQNLRQPEQGDYNFSYGNLITRYNVTDVEDEPIPISFKLYQNYPNPFNPTTIISYQLPVAGKVSLKVFDILGREVATLVDEFKQAGVFNSEFSVHQTNSGQVLNSQLSSGVYFYSLRVSSSTNSGQEFHETKKMVLLK